MASYAKDWPTVACRDCRMDTLRELLTKLRSSSTTFYVCPSCLARRKRERLNPFEDASRKIA